jgi:hypothetical protein
VLYQADEFIAKKAKEGIKVTYTHIALKALGVSIKAGQGQLAKIIFGKVVPIEDLDILTLIDVDGKDLAGVTVRKCDKLPIRELIDQIAGKIKKIKLKQDGDHKKQTGAAE